MDQVGHALELRWGSDLGEEIARSGRDATAVLVAVLGALQPWAEMMRDLLELMAADGDVGGPSSRRLLRAAGGRDPAQVRLLADVRHGPGPETLVIDRRLDNTYRLWVHRYREGELGECEPVVLFSCGELHRTFECPAGDGPWWCVLEVGGANRELRGVESREEPAAGHRL